MTQYLDKANGKIYNGKKELEGVVANVEKFYRLSDKKTYFRVSKYEYHKPISKCTENENNFLTVNCIVGKTSYVREGLAYGIYTCGQLRNWHINGIASEPIVAA